MTKAELVDAVQSQLGSSSKMVADEAITAVFNAILGALTAKDEVRIPGFGKFETRFQPERQQRVFGEVKDMPARHVVKFVPATALKEAVA